MDKKKDSKDNKMNRLLIIVVLVGVLAWMLGMPKGQAKTATGGRLELPTNAVQPPETSQGILYTIKLGQKIPVTIRPGHWIGVSCDDPGTIIVGEITTPDVFWRFRCDLRDDLIFPMDPINWAATTSIKLPQSKNLQADIDASKCSAETASVTFEAMTKAQYLALDEARKRALSNQKY